MNQPGARIDRHHPPVAAHCPVQQHVRVQLRVGGLVLDCPGSGMAPTSRDQRRGLGVNHGLLVDPLADHRNLLDRVPQGTVDCVLVRPLDLGAQFLICDGPDRADRLRRRERRVERRHGLTGPAGPAKRSAGVGSPNRHQCPQLLPADHHVGVAADGRRTPSPPPRRLNPLTALQVVVTELGGLGFALQVVGVARR